MEAAAFAAKIEIWIEITISEESILECSLPLSPILIQTYQHDTTKTPFLHSLSFHCLLHFVSLPHALKGLSATCIFGGKDKCHFVCPAKHTTYLACHLSLHLSLSSASYFFFVFTAHTSSLSLLRSRHLRCKKLYSSLMCIHSLTCTY